MVVTPNDLQSSRGISNRLLPDDLPGKLRSPWLTMRVMSKKTLLYAKEPIYIAIAMTKYPRESIFMGLFFD
jgi:hypothetical protein